MKWTWYDEESLWKINTLSSKQRTLHLSFSLFVVFLSPSYHIFSRPSLYRLPSPFFLLPYTTTCSINQRSTFFSLLFVFYSLWQDESTLYSSCPALPCPTLPCNVHHPLDEFDCPLDLFFLPAFTFAQSHWDGSTIQLRLLWEWNEKKRCAPCSAHAPLCFVHPSSSLLLSSIPPTSLHLFLHLSNPSFFCVSISSNPQALSVSLLFLSSPVWYILLLMFLILYFLSR